jgi:predicted Zn-dependent protease
VNLPRWVVEELTRVTPKERVAPALEALGEAAAAFSEGRYHQAMKWAEQAKGLSSRDATTRELLGLSAYRVGDWSSALRELRTYRRLAGETTHMPVEMDCLRALGRSDDVAEVWQELQRRGGRPGVLKEGQVVYASMLIDEGDVEEARRLVTPRGLKADPFPEDLRLWYVAARAAALDGDPDEARRLRNAILVADPGFPGIDELETLIAAA